MKYIFEFAV